MSVHPDQVIVVGPSPLRRIAGLTPESGLVVREPLVLGVTAEYPASSTNASATIRLFNLVGDSKRAFAWCRSQPADDLPRENGWFAPIPGTQLVAAQNDWLVRFHQAHGTWRNHWNGTLPADPTAIHAIAYLGDGPSSVLASVLHELRLRYESRETSRWVHVHLVMPMPPDPCSGPRRRAAQCAIETLSRLCSDSMTHPGVHEAWWLLGGDFRAADANIDEAIRLVGRLSRADSMDSITEWCQQRQRLVDETGGPSARLYGSHRCFGAAPDLCRAQPWAHAMPETWVPPHRRDLLDRIVIGWNVTPDRIREWTARDPRWQATTAIEHRLPGAVLAFAWLGLEPRDLWWWNRDGSAVIADGAEARTTSRRITDAAIGGGGGDGSIGVT